jgi:tRNA A-37 threonylcarbamoyl transferase component Bud32
VAPGVDLAAAIPPDGDPDRALTHPACRVVKLQPKVIVGRMATAAGVLWVKRYNVFAWRTALASLWGRSPAFAALAGARLLAARGFATPEVVAAVEFRSAGVLRRSFFVTREVPEATTADLRWQAILRDADPARRRRARRAFARGLGDLFRRLHAAGLYHADLKDVNILVGGPPDRPTCVLLDLERVRVPSWRRGWRVKNLVQLDRTLGRRASATDRLRFLHAYLRDVRARARRRTWVRAVERRARWKERRRTADPPAGSPPISCIVVCQNEEAVLGRCLESVAWCDEVVVVDGGSTDRTREVALRFTDRVLVHPWPGYRAQKQFALAAARAEWVLNVDADERVTPELAAEIRSALARVPRDVAGFAVPRLVCYLGRWWYRGGWYPRRVLRVVRRDAARWGGVDPHERAEVRGRVVALRWPIIHYTYADVADHVRSVNKLTSIAAAQPGIAVRVGAARLVAEPAWRVVRSYGLQRGVLEGLPGLFVALTGGFYVFLRWAKVWERRAAARPAAAAPPLDPPEVRP